MVFLSAGGCDRSGHRGGAATNREADVAGIKAAIQADQDKWNEEYHARPKSAEALAAHYAPDAYIVPAGMNPMSGQLNIGPLFAALARDQDFDMSFAPDRIEVAASGDLAVARGRFSDRYTDPRTNAVKSETGTYINVYKKQADGSWKVIEDFSTIDAAPRRPPM